MLGRTILQDAIASCKSGAGEGRAVFKDDGGIVARMLLVAMGTEGWVLDITGGTALQLVIKPKSSSTDRCINQRIITFLASPSTRDCYENGWKFRHSNRKIHLAGENPVTRPHDA